MFGELLPLGGGDPIPLLKKSLLVGRRESCDIVLRFSNVSAHHCQLFANGGYWHVKDLNSRNGVKVNGIRVTEKRIDPGDELSVAKHKYRVDYSPMDLGAVGPPPPSPDEQNIFSRSLLERAGLQKQQVERMRPNPHDEGPRYEIGDPGRRTPPPPPPPVPPPVSRGNPGRNRPS
jgi:predicted component of type VI protein secretion system